MSIAVAAASTASVVADSACDSPAYYSLAYRWRALVTAASLLTGLVVTLFSGPMLVFSFWTNTILLTLSWVTLALGLTIRLWGTAAIAGRKGLRVVSEGPYALCRNPLYWGTFLIAVSMVLFLQSGVFAVSLIPPVLLYLFGVVPAEEHFLQNQLGANYMAYCEKTPRWLPKWSSGSLLRTSPASLDAWYAECHRQAAWLLLPLLAYAACAIRNMGWCPQFFFFS